MGWLIECNTESCDQKTWAQNIDVLLYNHRDPQGWFVCQCGKSTGFIKKEFSLQEDGEFWAPFLRGAIKLGEKDNTYQPFVFMVSYESAGPVTDLWFSYYKDTRGIYPNGRLKLGYGPGGPPVLGMDQVYQLLNALAGCGMASRADFKKKLIDGPIDS